MSAMYSLIAKLLEWKRANPKLSLFSMILILAFAYHKLKKYIRGKRSLQNKVVLVTGGVSGIGRQTALLLKRLNAKVIVWDINQAGLDEMSSNVDMVALVDITSKAAVTEAAAAVFEQYSQGIDVLINNAGIVIGKPILELTERQIRKTFDVNTIAHFWTIQAFLPKMIDKKSWCQIVTISSTAGRTGVPQLTDYCASKYAVRGLTESVWAELNDMGHSHIGITVVQPFLINTGMFTGAVASTTWIMKLFGCYFLEQDYVAAQIVRGVQYNIRNVVLPSELDVIMRMEHLMPDGVKDFLLSKGPSFHQLMGRAPPKK